MEKGIEEINEQLKEMATFVKIFGGVVCDKATALLEEDWMEIGDERVLKHARDLQNSLSALLWQYMAGVRVVQDIQDYLDDRG